MNCMFALFPYVIVTLLGFKKCFVYFLYFLYLGDADGELIARLCGQSAPSVPLVIAAPQVWVHFVSDENTEDKGFWAHYTFEGKWLDRLLPWLTSGECCQSFGDMENSHDGINSQRGPQKLHSACHYLYPSKASMC